MQLLHTRAEGSSEVVLKIRVELAAWQRLDEELVDPVDEPLVCEIAKVLGRPVLPIWVQDEPTNFTELVLQPLERNGELTNALVDKGVAEQQFLLWCLTPCFSCGPSDARTVSWKHLLAHFAPCCTIGDQFEDTPVAQPIEHVLHRVFRLDSSEIARDRVRNFVMGFQVFHNQLFRRP